MADFNGVVGVAEQRNGKLQSTSLEVLTVARKIADDLGTEVTAILLGSSDGDTPAERGADRVWMVSAPELEHFQAGVYNQVLGHLLAELKPEVIVGAATIAGKALFGRLAANLGTGLASDAVAIETDKEKRTVAVTRAVYGGNAVAQWVVRTLPQIITIRSKVFGEAKPNGEKGEVIQKDVPRELFSSPAKWLKSAEERGQSVNLSQADIIVSGGRGLRGPENFAMIDGLANALGGAVGASRAAVDAGWISYAHQVGQTGKTVNPKLYVACGISGAIQHLAGMQSSKCIVAINKDPEAPIFKIATYGIVGDLFVVVPALTQKLKAQNE
jgi:electron transfer flavoprotein alpha subunit